MLFITSGIHRDAAGDLDDRASTTVLIDEATGRISKAVLGKSIGSGCLWEHEKAGGHHAAIFASFGGGRRSLHQRLKSLSRARVRSLPHAQRCFTGSEGF